jgi:hypothetical protein
MKSHEILQIIIERVKIALKRLFDKYNSGIVLA